MDLAGGNHSAGWRHHCRRHGVSIDRSTRPDDEESVIDSSSQGKYDEAEEVHGQVLALRERVLGKEHPDTLTSVYCLAYLLHQKKRYKDAEVFYDRAYAGYRKTLGEKHPTTAACSQHYSSMLKKRKTSKIWRFIDLEKE